MKINKKIDELHKKMYFVDFILMCEKDFVGLLGNYVTVHGFALVP